MPKLIYSMLTSLDGYIEDEQGKFDWARPSEEVHSYCTQLGSTLGVYLYGRKMYETMLFWETAHTIPNLPPHLLDWAKHWQATEKVVFSRSLTEPPSARTTFECELNPAAILKQNAAAKGDLSISGPGLAAHALKAGLVDEIIMIVFPVIVGGGKRFFPSGVELDLQLIEQHQFGDGVISLRYSVRNELSHYVS